MKMNNNNPPHSTSDFVPAKRPRRLKNPDAVLVVDLGQDGSEEIQPEDISPDSTRDSEWADWHRECSEALGE